jgi:hypothetical protein
MNWKEQVLHPGAKGQARAWLLARTMVLIAAIAGGISHRAQAQSPEISMREFSSSQIKKGVRAIGFGGDGATWGNKRHHLTQDRPCGAGSPLMRRETILQSATVDGVFPLLTNTSSIERNVP